MAYENVASDAKTWAEMKGKVTSLLNKFRNYHYIFLTCSNLNLLEKAVPVSKIFEGEGLLPFEIKGAIKTTLADLNELAEDDCDDIDGHLQRFYPVEGESIIVSSYDSPLDKSRKHENCQPIKITFTDFTSVREETITAGKVIRKKAANKLIKTLEDRFQSFNEDVFNLMNWYNPQNWTDGKDYGIEEIKAFANHFQVPLSRASFDETKIRKEWRDFR